MDGECPVKVLMIAEVVNLESILRIGQSTRTLLQYAPNNFIVRVTQFLTCVRDTQKPAAVDSALAVYKHSLARGVLQKLLHGGFELGVPIQNICVQTVYGIQTLILVRKRFTERRRTIIVERAVYYMRN